MSFRQPDEKGEVEMRLDNQAIFEGKMEH